MATKADHLDWADGNAELAERLWESENPVERRWSAVVARYIGDHQSAATWFAPYFTSEDEAIERALELMRTVVPELKRIAWS